MDGPDLNEIPVPEIVTSLGTMPGVAALPIRKELPDVLVMEDGRVSRARSSGRSGGRKLSVCLSITRSGRCRRRRGMWWGERSVTAGAGWSGEVPAGAADVWARGKARACDWDFYAG